MKWSVVFQPATRLPPTWRQVASPLWLASDDERTPAWAWVQWFRRNPFANLFGCVIGLACYHRHYVNTMDGQNFPARGWGFAWTVSDDCWLPRPWIAWRGAHHEAGAGWKSHGGFGINWRRSNSTNAGQGYHR